MPDSFTGNDRYFCDDLVTLIHPETAIDVGIGHGKIAGHLQMNCPRCRVTGHEIWPDYLTSGIRALYAEIVIGDFRDWLKNNVDWSSDLVVFGDVLEHFRHSEALDLLDLCHYRAKWTALFFPLSYLQGTHEGNKYEAHQCVLYLGDLQRYNVVHYFKCLNQNIYYCLLRGLRA
jgi:hypothetical protein